MMASPNNQAIPKATFLQLWLKIDSKQKPSIYAQIYDTADITLIAQRVPLFRKISRKTKVN